MGYRPTLIALKAWTALKSIVLLARPSFLIGGTVLYGLGALMAWTDGAAVNLRALLWGQAAVSSTQLTVHLANEYFDRHADALHSAARRPRWSGGSGVIPGGTITPGAARALSLGALLTAIAIAMYVAGNVHPTRPSIILLGLAIAGGWFYSAPPLSLHSSGWGELVGAILVACLTPLLGFHLQTPIEIINADVRNAAVGIGAGVTSTMSLTNALPRIGPLVPLQMSMLIAVSLPDMGGDGLAGKRTLAVRVGAMRASFIAVAAIATSYVLAVALLHQPRQNLHVMLGYIAWLPLALWLIAELLSGAGRDPTRWNRLAFWSIGLVIGSAITVGAALVISASS